MTHHFSPRTGWWGPQIARSSLAALLIFAGGCGDDDPTGTESGELVTIQGTITDLDDVPQGGVFAHIVYGSSAAPVGVAHDESDAQGNYSVTGNVPADQCYAVQIWVLETSTFSAAASRLARETVGQCGASTLDIQLEGAGPVSF